MLASSKAFLGAEGTLGRLAAHAARHLNCRSSSTECRAMHNHYGGMAALQSQPERRLCARLLTRQCVGSFVFGGVRPFRRVTAWMDNIQTEPLSPCVHAR